MFIVAILILMAQIVVHEYGHFLAARKLKIPVREFAVGFGPKLWSKKSKTTETLYSVRAIPLGGYCAIDPLDEGNVSENISITKQIIVYGAGVVGNLLFSFLVTVIFVIVLSNGTAKVMLPPHALLNYEETYVEGSPRDVSEYMVLKNIKFEGQEYSDIENMRAILGLVNEDGQGSPVTLVFQDFWRTREVVVNGKTDPSQQYGLSYNHPLTVPTLISGSFRTFGTFLEMQLDVLKIISNGFLPEENQLSLNQIPEDADVEIQSVVGFVADINGLQESVPGLRHQLLYVINATIAIGISLAVLNLLPIPCLDGGRIVIAMFEGITRKSMSDRLKTAFIMVSFVLIIGFSILIMAKDVVKIILDF